MKTPRTKARTSTTNRQAGATPAGPAGHKPAGYNTRPFRRLLPFAFRYPGRVALMLAFLLIGSISTLAIPSFAGKLVDQGFTARNLDMISAYGWAIIGVAAIIGIANGARLYFVSVVGERVLLDIRGAVFNHLLTLDAAYFDTHRVGELTSRLNGDVATVRAAIGPNLSSTLRNLITLIGAVVLMFLTSPYLALAVVVIVPALTIPIVIAGRKLRRMSRRAQDAIAEMSALATEAFAAPKTIKSFSQELELSRHYGRLGNESYHAETSRLVARAVLQAIITFVAVAALVLLVWWGAKAVIEGQVTAGQLAQFMIYALMASNALSSLSETAGQFQQIAGATERLVEILDTRPELEPAGDPKPFPVPPLGTVEFDNVAFAYRARPKIPVLDGVSFSIARGETVALVGASGAGKSTIFALAQRFYDVAGGSVKVDGLDVREVDQEQLRRHFAYVEQEPTIFAGSIADNIRFGKPEASMAEIRAAGEAALVSEYVSDLADGYDTVVGERGIMLSGGQKQRIAIARALLKDAPILLLDEATSALDAQSEKLVQIALAHLLKGRTALIIAHRLATIRDAHRILVLERGRLIDEGTHDQLVRKGGRYAELARLQFGLNEKLPAE